MKKSYIHFVYMLIIATVSYTIISFTNSEKTVDVIKKYKSASSPKASVKMKKARWEYFNMMLRDPKTKQIPHNIRKKELSYANHLREKNKSLRKTNDLGWQEAGPNNVGGRTRALAVDITDPNIVISGGASGGIWKSTDKGTSWQMKSTTSQNLSVTTIAQDPRSGNTNTWYYGTGEYAGSAGDLGFTHKFSGDGIYKSNDNGETWSVLQPTLSSNFTQWDSPFDFVNKIEINPVTGSVFVTANGIGLFKSTDGGNSFSLVIGGSGHHLSCDVSIATDGTMVAVLSSPFQGQTPDNTPGVYKSTDDGSTWTNITPATFPQSHERSEVEIAPSNPKTVYIITYAGTDQNTQQEDIRFFKLDLQSGNSEDRSNNLPAFNSPFGGEEHVKTQGGYNLTLAIKPDDENFVMIGSTNLFKSTNGFATKPNNAKLDWIGGYHTTYFGYPKFHPDIHSYSFEPNNPNAMWWGHDGGLSYTSDITNTNYPDVFPWENKNNGYNVTQFYHITIPKNSGDNRIMGGTQDNGTPFFVFDGNIGAQIEDVSSGDGAYSYFGSNYAYSSVQNGIVLRLGYDNNNYPNNQSSYTEITPTDASGQQFINPFAIDPNNEDIIYYPAGNSLWRNDQLSSIPDNQNGTSVGWSKLDNLSLPSGYVITTIAVSESNPNHRIYYGGIDYNQNSSGAHKLYRLDNANTASNGAVEITVPGTSQWSYPNSIVLNPDNADEIIVVFSNYNIVGIYHSLDGGQSFTAIEGNLEGDGTLPGPSIRSAEILPSSNGTQYFLATSTGVYSTINLNGANTVWNLEGANTIGNVVVNSLTARKSDGRIVAGTHGRGAFTASVGSGTGGGNAVANVNINSLTLQAKPGQSSSASFILSNNGDASLNYNVSVSGSFGSNLNKISNPKFELKPPDVNSEAYKEFISKSKIMLAKEQLRKSQNNSVAPSESRSINGSDYLLLDDGDMNADSFAGLGGGLDFDCYNEFSLSGSGFEVESIEFFIKTEQEFSNFINAAIYDSNDSLLQFGVFAFDLSSNGKWFDATLNPKIKFNNGESFKVEIYSYSLINQPMGTDTDAQIPNNSYFFNPLTVKWENLNTQPGFENGAFLIRAKGTRTGGGGSNQNPVAVATASKSQASINESITFNGSQSYDNDGQISQYFWEFGDGNSSTQPIVSHSYSNSGTYNIKLTVTDNLGATGTATGQIIISGGGGGNQNPVAVATASKSQASINESISFDGSQSYDNDGQISQYLWEFGDGNSITQAMATHSYSNSGTYNIKLTVTDNLGAKGTATGQIVIGGSIQNLVTANPTSGTIAPGGSQTITLTLDAQNLDVGSYTGQVSISTNGGNITIPIDYLVNVEKISSLSNEFTLSQNYPNPFNPSTVIEFSLPYSSEVSLKIYDMLGKEVVNLLEEQKVAGQYRVSFDGSSLSSGIYFYKLEADNFRASKKMLLIK